MDKNNFRRNQSVIFVRGFISRVRYKISFHIHTLERNKHPRDEIIDRKLSCVPFVPFFALLNSFETMRSGDGVSRK